MLSSEYGWAKSEILDQTCLDEAFYYALAIRQRKNFEYQMQLAIVQNPHTQKPQDLWDALMRINRPEENNKLDKTGFEAFKTRLKENPRIVVK